MRMTTFYKVTVCKLPVRSRVIAAPCDQFPSFKGTPGRISMPFFRILLLIDECWWPTAETRASCHPTRTTWTCLLLDYVIDYVNMCDSSA